MPFRCRSGEAQTQFRGQNDCFYFRLLRHMGMMAFQLHLIGFVVICVVHLSNILQNIDRPIQCVPVHMNTL